jgi:hypothetical protein
MCWQLNEGHRACAACSSEAYPARQGSGSSLPHSTLDPTLSTTAALSVAALLLGQLTVSSPFWWLDASRLDTVTS